MRAIKKMVIKDLLSKVSKPSSEADPKVAALREKLASLQQSKQPAQPTGLPNKTAPTQSAVPTPLVSSSAPAKPVDEIEQLAKASFEEQKHFAQYQNPELRLKEERTQKLITNQVSELIEVNTELQKRLKQLEQEKTRAKQELEATQKKNEEITQKMGLIDKRLEKFMGLYEIITNQYNPFHEELKKKPLPALSELQGTIPPPAFASVEQPVVPPVATAPSVEKKSVVLSDGLTGEQAQIEFEQGRISSENAQKMAQLLAELEAAEQEKTRAPDPALVEAKEQELVTHTTTELHTLLEDFEARLKQYLDVSLQEKLHATFSHLEEVLNEEIQNAVRSEVSKLKEADDVISSALKEIESLQSSDASFAAVQEEIVHDLRATDDQIKAIPPHLYFRLSDGRVLKSKHDLILALETLSEEAFSAHVSSEHNHFADWLTLAIQDPVGESLRGKSRQEMTALLKEV